jgi:hypothetical protein
LLLHENKQHQPAPRFRNCNSGGVNNDKLFYWNIFFFDWFFYWLLRWTSNSAKKTGTNKKQNFS